MAVIDNRDPEILGSNLLEAHKLFPDAKLHELANAFDDDERAMLDKMQAITSRGNGHARVTT